MIAKTESDHILILCFSVVLFCFNLYLLYLPCIPIIPDKLILIVTLLISISLIILIPIKLMKYRNQDTPAYAKTILDKFTHWVYLIIIPVGILLARSLSLITFMICTSWFALIGRAIYNVCPLSVIAEKKIEIGIRDDLVNVYFLTCCLVGCIRLFIN